MCATNLLVELNSIISHLYQQVKIINLAIRCLDGLLVRHTSIRSSRKLFACSCCADSSGTQGPIFNTMELSHLSHSPSPEADPIILKVIWFENKKTIGTC